MKNKKKLFHFHLEDGYGNKKTLVCLLVDGAINIQFYDIVNGNMAWKRDASLPVENEEGEDLDEFKARVKYMLNHSTVDFVKEVNTNVTFA